MMGGKVIMGVKNKGGLCYTFLKWWNLVFNLILYIKEDFFSSIKLVFAR